MKTNEIKVDKLKILNVGKSGTWKTPFAATFPKPYFFDCDDGMLTLRNVEGVEFDTYRDADLKNPTGYTKMARKLGELQKECPYETIVIDSITTLSEMVMNKVLAANGRAGGVPQLQDYNFQMIELKNFVRSTLALPVHVIFTAHENTVQDELTGEVTILPLIVGKLAERLPVYFDEVYRAEVVQKEGKTIYRLRTKGSGKYVAKSRLGCLAPFETPSFEAIMAKVEASEAKGGK